MKMSNLLMILALGACCSAVAAETIAYWTFDEDPLGVTDASGQGHELVSDGGVSISEGAAIFDGNAHVFNTKRSLPFHSGKAYTIECFLKPASQSGMIPFELTRLSGSVMCYPHVSPDPLEDNIVNFKSVWGSWSSRSLPDYCGDKWHHLAVVFDPTAEEQQERYRVYLDYVEYTTGYVGDDVTLEDCVLHIGSRQNSQCLYRGEIDDVRISVGALTPDDFLVERTNGKTKPILYYPFDSEETACVDASGNGYSLTYGGTGISFQDGYASFSGGQALCSSIPVDLSAYDELTIEFFVRQHEARSEGIVMELGSQVVDGTFYVDINGWGPGTLGSVGVPWHAEVTPAGAVGEGWRHFAAVFNVHEPGVGRWIAYLDGTPVAPDYGLQNAIEGLKLLNDVLYIGSRGNANFFLDADLDDVKITGKALLPGQFMRRRSGALDEETPDVVAYWPFDQRDPLADASGNGHRLESDGVTFPKKGACAAFDGNHTLCQTCDFLPLGKYRDLTVEFFMRTSSLDEGIALELSSNLNEINNRGGFCFALNQKYGVPADETQGNMEACFAVLHRSDDVRYNNDFMYEVCDGEWHHYALVYDSEAFGDDMVRLYCDGVQKFEHAIGGRDFGFATRLLSERLYIGSRNNQIVKLVGELDDIRITGRALPPEMFLKKRTMPRGSVLYVR